MLHALRTDSIHFLHEGVCPCVKKHVADKHETHVSNHHQPNINGNANASSGMDVDQHCNHEHFAGLVRIVKNMEATSCALTDMLFRSSIAFHMSKLEEIPEAFPVVRWVVEFRCWCCDPSLQAIRIAE